MTNTERKLAKIIASQISQAGLSEEFKNAFLAENTNDVQEMIEIGSKMWSDKIEKIQSIYLTRDGAKSAMNQKVLSII